MLGNPLRFDPRLGGQVAHENFAEFGHLFRQIVLAEAVVVLEGIFGQPIREQGQRGIERNAVANQTVSSRVKARQHRGATRSANLAGRRVPGESHSLPSDPVEMRCLYRWVATTGQAVKPLLVGADPEDIRRFHLRR